ncbi:MAG: hypothetical protein N3E47_00625 [Candidatus Bathyarchaeota archaeon]|nr:hypothetical protein [Candidatus Bathyarchaeota archaeon]
MKMKVKAMVKLFGVVVTIILSTLTLYGSYTINIINIMLLKEYGLISVFLSAFFSHMAIIARGFFVPLFLSLTGKYNLLILGLSAGLGGGLGEIIAYYWGLSIKETLSSSRDENDILPKWIEKYGLLAILLFASSPLPDTPIMLLAGAFRFPAWKLIIIQIVGKTTLYTLGAIFGGFIFMELKSITEEAVTSTIILVVSVILCVLASWNKSRRKILGILDRGVKRVMRQKEP